MWSRSSRFPERRTLLSLLAALAAGISPAAARAQACCAGGSVVTPGRLELHEDALVGLQIRAATILGSWDPGGHYVASPQGDIEGDFEEDLFGAVRVLGRGQVALLVPFVQTYLQDPMDGGHFGGGVGDVNVSARYDILIAGQARYVPGVAVLAGLTLPTGRPPELALPPLATGGGAFQGTGGIALEQTFGSWLVNATGYVAVRSARFHQQLAPQATLLAAVAYTLPNDMALALSASYAFEGSARADDGTSVPVSSRRATVVTLSGLWPLNDAWRLLGGIYLNPPVDALGANQPATGGLTLTVIRSWS
jgi:hypothetical protein